MNILFLIEKSNSNFKSYIDTLSKFKEDKIIIKSDGLTEKFLIDNNIKIILKDRYKFASSLESCNLDLNNISYFHFHPGYLPYNMKMDSNLWSIINDNPKGATIIRMFDLNWKKFDIISRQEIFYSDNDTLSTSFEKCCMIFKKILDENWDKMRHLTYQKIDFNKKDGKIFDGSEKKNFLEILEKGYDTNVKEIKDLWNKFKSH